MSEEHYPAHSVGNDDIIALDFTKLMDTLMGDNQEFKKIMNDAIDSGYYSGSVVKTKTLGFFNESLAC